ncbi:MAG: ParB/RepB/Spo0J family partition protein [Candidatus Saccharibacteria bacterium]|nr:ParB/RepB/Spo0J family partition protein [Candidatus Saccharibacteria bacterium]
MPNKPSAKATGLGRGLDSLIPKTIDTPSLLEKNERIQNIPTSEIRPDKNQPRTHFDETKLEELAASVKQYGILQPLIVTASEQKMYTIVAGERRWRAAKMAGLDKLPCIVRSPENIERLEIALIENVQRVDLSPLEQATSIERLHQQFNVPYKTIASRLGKAPATVNNIVRLLQLPDKAKDALKTGLISEGHARALLAIKEFPEQQLKLLDMIVQKPLTVRQAEQYAIDSKNNRGKRQSPAAKKKSRLVVKTDGTKRLEKRLKTDVRLRRLAKGGRLEITFSDDKQLEKLLKKLD